MENTTRIILRTPDEAAHFVDAASRCNFDVDIFYNRIVIDAKSIIGVMSMDLRNILTVRCYGHSEDFEKVLQKYAAA